MSTKHETLVGTFTMRSAAGIIRDYAKRTDDDAADVLACKLTVALDTLPESADVRYGLDAGETLIYRAAMRTVRN